MWRDTFEINLMAAVRMIRAVLPGMLQRSRGTILNTGSLNARLPDPLVLDYSAAKAALVNMAKALSKDLAPEAASHCREPSSTRWCSTAMSMVKSPEPVILAGPPAST